MNKYFYPQLDALGAGRPMIPEYQQRVLNEKTELDEKLRKLLHYIRAGCPGCSEKEKPMLEKQHEVMNKYADILHKRINSWPAWPPTTTP